MDEGWEGGAGGPSDLQPRALTGELHRVTPAFSPGGDLVTCASGQSLILLSTVTGEVVYRFKGQETHHITCLGFSSDRYLYTGSVDGTLSTWDYVEMRHLHDKKLGREILAMSVSAQESDLLYLALGRKITDDNKADGSEAEQAGQRKGDEGAKQKSKKKWKIVEYRSKKGKQAKIIKFTSAPFFVHCTPDGFVIAASSNRLVVYSVKEREVYSEVVFDESTPREGSLIQAVAVNPASQEIATGDINGRLYIWHTLFQKLGSLPQAKALPKKRGLKKLKRSLLRSEVKRWHSHGVSCIAFTPDGQFLLSGGEEAVLVVCQLGKSYNMTFLPRLGSRITGLAISRDGSSCALTTRTNSLRLAHPMDLRISWEFKGLAHTSGAETVDMSAVARIWPHPSRPWEIISNCFPGKLQFYDLGTETVSKELEVVASNVVSRMDAERIVPPWVTHLAMSSDGQHMATVENRVGEESIKRVTLKFWDWDPTNKRFALASVVDRPHEGQGHGRLIALAYHPLTDIVASSSASGTFNLWALVPDDDEMSGRSSSSSREMITAGGGGGGGVAGVSRLRWICQATVPFNRGASRCLAFSSDGTVLAVGAGKTVALWDPIDVKLVTTLIDPQAGASDEVNDITFIPNTPRLVVATKRTLVVWDLLSLTPVQRYEAGNIRHLCATAPSPTQGWTVNGQNVHFAVAMQGIEEGAKAPQSLVLFNAFTPAPLVTRTLQPGMSVLSMVITEGGMDEAGTGLCYMTRDQMLILGPPIAEKSKKKARKRALAFGGSSSSSGASQQDTNKRPKPSPVEVGKSRETPSLADLLGATTGHLPRPSAVFDSFLAGILPAQAPPLIQEPSSSSSAATTTSASKPAFFVDRAPIGGAAGETAEGKKAKDAALMPPPSVPLLPPCGVKKDLLKLLGKGLSRSGGGGGEGEAPSQENEDAMDSTSTTGSSNSQRKGGAKATPVSAGKKAKAPAANPVVEPVTATAIDGVGNGGGGRTGGRRRRSDSNSSQGNGAAAAAAASASPSAASDPGGLNTPKTRSSKRRSSKT